MKLCYFLISTSIADNCGDFCEAEHNACVSNSFCDNLDCNSQCYRDFANCLDECINDKTILILKTHSDPIWSHTFNWGGQATAADFELGSSTQVSYSCSVTFKNENYVFGGLNLSHQISKVNGCSLENTGESLPFRFDNGICTADSSAIYLCFEYDTKHICRTWPGYGDFSTLAESEEDHYLGGVNIIGGELIAFVGKGTASTEMYNHGEDEWNFLADIDADVSFLFYTTSVVIDGGAEMLVLGGYANEGLAYPKSTDLTWRLKIDSNGEFNWSRGKRLLQPRDSHTVIRKGAKQVISKIENNFQSWK
ncbi:unnamed protein product [Oikopleura dioica]|uniref:Uncharacterized protein n=1 Tax=Oikopleura dioica TaxID=34765 RepID=E4YBI9_OIKDI|nr:unnamed protein product [Oikopleura dioica]